MSNFSQHGKNSLVGVTIMLMEVSRSSFGSEVDMLIRPLNSHGVFTLAHIACTQKPHHPGNVQIVVFQALAVKLKCAMQQNADVFILCN